MSAAESARRRDPLGYAMVVAAYLLMGGTASLVDMTDAPTSVVLCVRMAFASLVLPALTLALAGLAVILAPGLFGDGARTSAVGIAAGVGAGLAYAAFVLLVKDLTRRVASTTVTFSEAGLDALFLLPLALWQLSGSGYQFTLRDLVVLVVMGVVFTALAHTLWTEGTRRVRAEHVSILGYVEPVAGPVYAIFLLGQLPSLWTIVGGVLILSAGMLVVVFGRGEGEASLAALAEAEPL